LSERIGSNGSENLAGGEVCLACGLCCNGVIFADVKLHSGEAARLEAHGLTSSRPALTEGGRASKLPQPCAALDGCRCRVYAERPRYCREFECLLLKNLRAGRLGADAALRVIRTARERAEKVRDLLRALGDNDEPTALSIRFRRMTRRLEQLSLEDDTADLYGQLTLAVHDLNLLVRDAFYPG
jgi:Fe-S-cluster containining protein